MALPKGFDPEKMTFGVVKSPELSQHHNTTATATTSSYRRSWFSRIWTKIDSAIASFGNLIDDNLESIHAWSLAVMMVAEFAGAIIWIFQADGFWLLKLIGAFFMVGIGTFIIMVASYIWAAILKLIRFFFWNIYTLLAVLILTGGIVTFCCIANNQSAYKPRTEQVVKESTQSTKTAQYKCMVNHLNVRATPSTNGAILGVITKGEIVTVHEKTKDYAKISYKGKYGYVSTHYIAPY